MGDPIPELIPVLLRDQSEALMRPLCEADREDLARGYNMLSPEAKYRRFWTQGEEMGTAMLDRILNADQINHAVWAVMNPELDYPGMGAASYWRSQENPDEAEFAATVLDVHQNKGIGTLLLATLWCVARYNGIKEFVGYVLPENRIAIRWLRNTGATGEWDGYKVTMRWPLDDLNHIPDTPNGAELIGWLEELAPRIGLILTEGRLKSQDD